MQQAPRCTWKLGPNWPHLSKLQSNEDCSLKVFIFKFLSRYEVHWKLSLLNMQYYTCLICPKLQRNRDRSCFALSFERLYHKIKSCKKYQASNCRPKFALLIQFLRQILFENLVSSIFAITSVYLYARKSN